MEPGGLQFMGFQRVGHNLTTKQGVGGLAVFYSIMSRLNFLLSLCSWAVPYRSGLRFFVVLFSSLGGTGKLEDARVVYCLLQDWLGSSNIPVD